MKTQPIGKLVAVLATLMFMFLSFEPTGAGDGPRFDGTKQPMIATGSTPVPPFPAV